MAATPQNVEMEAAKFLHKLIQESTDEPTKLATKLHVILQHMRSSGKENSMPYQVISRAMETVINQHGLDIEALMASRQPLTQGGDSSLSQIAGPSQQAAVENDSKSTLTAEDAAKLATFSSKPLHGPGSAGHDIYQGSANQLNSIKSHGSEAGFSGSYESAEPGNPLSMQFSNSYDNQSAATLMHKGPAGKALEQEGRFPNVMANSSKTVQARVQQFEEDEIVVEGEDKHTIDMKSVARMQAEKNGKGPAGGDMYVLINSLLEQNSSLMDGMIEQRREFIEKLEDLKTDMAEELREETKEMKQELQALKAEVEKGNDSKQKGKENKQKVMARRIQALKAQVRKLKKEKAAAVAAAANPQIDA